MFNKIFLNFYYKRKIEEDVVSPALVKAPPHRMPTYKQMGHKNAWSPMHLNTTTHKNPDST